MSFSSVSLNRYWLLRLLYLNSISSKKRRPAVGGFLAGRQGGFAHQVQVYAAGGGASFSDGPND